MPDTKLAPPQGTLIIQGPNHQRSLWKEVRIQWDETGLNVEFISADGTTALRSETWEYILRDIED